MGLYRYYHYKKKLIRTIKGPALNNLGQIMPATALGLERKKIQTSQHQKGIKTTRSKLLPLYTERRDSRVTTPPCKSSNTVCLIQ